ncbi:MAG: protein kinase [Planctomycetaceae bacterium]
MNKIATTDEMAALLVKSNLLSAQQSVAVANWRRRVDDPKAIVVELVRRGWVTRWQAQQLLMGRSRFFLGRYKLVEAIGKGGMGTVFKAEQPALGRTVALKVMAPELMSNQDAVTRFQREILAVGALNHPNIIVAHDADSVGDTYFLVMECVDGRNLKQWITHQSPLPLSWCCEVGRQVADGLQHAHEMGMVHRDIKPTNVLIVGESLDQPVSVKILDMGLARFASQSQIDDASDDFTLAAGSSSSVGSENASITMAGQIMGSPLYIAPEQAQDSKTVDIRADIYGLGATLFELLAGEPAFRRNDVMTTVRAKLTESAPAVRSIRQDVPAELDEAVSRMMARRPEDRFQTPEEVANCFGRLAQQFSGDAQSTSRGQWSATKPTGGSSDSLLDFIGQLSHQVEEETISRRSQVVQNLPNKRKRLLIGIATAGVCLLVAILAGMFGGSQAASSAAQKQKQVTEEKQTDLARMSATWVLSAGGQLTVAAEGEETSVQSVEGLPTKKFVIRDVVLEGVRGFTDTQLESMCTLVTIKTLNLRGSTVKDVHLESIARLTELQSLNLSLAKKITDRGLASLTALQKLQELDLKFTGLSDSGLTHLSKLTSLTYLDISLTNVSDAGVPALSKLVNLRVLDVRDTNMSRAGVKRLEQALTGCQIH